MFGLLEKVSQGVFYFGYRYEFNAQMLGLQTLYAHFGDEYSLESESFGFADALGNAGDGSYLTAEAYFAGHAGRGGGRCVEVA